MLPVGARAGRLERLAVAERGARLWRVVGVTAAVVVTVEHHACALAANHPTSAVQTQL